MVANKSQNGADIKHTVVYLNKTSKVVKGGRKFKFSVLVVAGDEKGRVGIGLGKAEEVTDAKDKASRIAKESLTKIHLRNGRTIHHPIKAKYGSGAVFMRPAPPGTGVIAGGPTRALMELLGVKDIVVKSLGSSNPHNMIKAALRGLTMSTPPRIIAEKRRMKVSDVVSQRESELLTPKERVAE